MDDGRFYLVGARDLGIADLLAALEPLLDEHFTLQWAPGRAHSPDGGPADWLKWFSWSEHGAWVRLPAFPARPTLVRSLAGRVGRTLVAHETNPAGDGWQVVSWSVPAEGEASIEAIADAGFWPPDEALLQVMGTLGVTGDAELEHGLYPAAATEVVPGAHGDDDEVDASLDGQRLATALALQQERRACCLRRYGPALYVFEAVVAEPMLSLDDSPRLYLNVATAEALMQAAAAAGQPLAPPTLAGLARPGPR